MRTTKLQWEFDVAIGWRNLNKPAPLIADTAHIYFISPAANIRYNELASEAEKNRARNMEPVEKGEEFLAARAWLRLLLTEYIRDTGPATIEVAIAEGGKPYLPNFPALQFSISHSYAAVAIAISLHTVGIDIEKLRPIPDWRSLAQGLLPPRAISLIANAPAADQERLFLQAFTAREASGKALAHGLGAPLQASSAAGMDNTAETAETVVATLPPLPGYTGHLCVLV